MSDPGTREPRAAHDRVDHAGAVADVRSLPPRRMRRMLHAYRHGGPGHRDARRSTSPSKRRRALLGVERSSSRGARADSVTRRARGATPTSRRSSCAPARQRRGEAAPSRPRRDDRARSLTGVVRASAAACPLRRSARRGRPRAPARRPQERGAGRAAPRGARRARDRRGGAAERRAPSSERQRRDELERPCHRASIAGLISCGRGRVFVARQPQLHSPVSIAPHRFEVSAGASTRADSATRRHSSSAAPASCCAHGPGSRDALRSPMLSIP